MLAVVEVIDTAALMVLPGEEGGWVPVKALPNGCCPSHWPDPGVRPTWDLLFHVSWLAVVLYRRTLIGPLKFWLELSEYVKKITRATFYNSKTVTSSV